MNKRAIELAVNFLVGFVLAIVAFGLGVSLLYTIFNDANDLHGTTQGEINTKITELLCTAKQKICVSGNRVNQKRNELAIYGVFIYNIYDREEDFDIFISPGIAYNKEKEEVVNTLELITKHDQKKIAPNDQDHIGVGIFIPKSTESGTYTFNVRVVPGDDKRKIYVNVK
jgi:hypothetical protein